MAIRFMIISIFNAHKYAVNKIYNAHDFAFNIKKEKIMPLNNVAFNWHFFSLKVYEVIFRILTA